MKSNPILVALVAVIAFLATGLVWSPLSAKSPELPSAPAGAQDADEAKNEEDAEAKAKKKQEEKESLESKIRASERKLRIAEMRLQHAKMDADSQRQAVSESRRQALEELEMAKGKLAQYQDIDSRNKIEQAKLSLRGAKDRAQEAAEELAQIELMYKDQDLDDRTAEFVVARGRRNAERSARQIAISERALAALTEHEVPRELRRLRLDVSRKQASLEKSERDSRSSELQKRIAIANVESEIEGLLEGIKKDRKKASEL